LRGFPYDKRRLEYANITSAAIYGAVLTVSANASVIAGLKRDMWRDIIAHNPGLYDKAGLPIARLVI
jgi:hypothetical protein